MKLDYKSVLLGIANSVLVFAASLVLATSVFAKKSESNLRLIKLYELIDLGAPNAQVVGDIKMTMNGNNPPILWLRYNIKEIYPLDCYGDKDGRQSYVLYVWTELTGKVRVQTFNSSCANGSFYSWRNFSHSTPEFDFALLNDDICAEVWREPDDNYDGPDSPPDTGTLVLQGSDGSGLPCEVLK